ncbi:MAG TPA: type II toxin-antitoxin system RelE/ParE family toxin [Gemmatimonadales bacterium]|nr:type II toxin-antitoxin system RelE/ParE family toxin [Gemmatimonadales bacterium]
MALKRLRWLGTAQSAVRRFPPDARRDVGYQLWRVQAGQDPSDWKAMAGVGPGVREIRVHAAGEFRVLYVATRPEAVYVVHAFVKKSQQTRKLDLEVARARLKELPRSGPEA